MTVYFYRHDPDDPDDPPIQAELPTSIDLKIWRPAIDGLPPRGMRRAENLTWWMFERIGLFADCRFAEVSLWRRGRQVHRLIVTPRWARFPFMAAGDLQIGGLWTEPSARGEGLARAAIAEARQRLGGESARFWYVVDPSNGSSIHLAQACGFRLVGVGRRTRPIGIALLGQFRIDLFCS